MGGILCTMGMLKDTFKLLNEIVTFGGAGRLEDAKKSYQETYDEYLVIYKVAEGFKNRIDDNVRAIGVTLTEAKQHLSQVEKLIALSVSDHGGLNVAFSEQTLEKVKRFNAGFNSAINVGAGSIAGGSLAVGSWGLVTALGSASTGMAISGLSGVAATNATLAWFGGGALAAGGAGMAGGAAVLGGLFAVPLVYFAAKGTHKKAKKFEDSKIEVELSITGLKTQIAEFPKILSAVQEKRQVINEICEVFISEAVSCSGIIRPHGMFSAIFQRVLALVGKPPYDAAQVAALDRLSQSVSNFLTGLGIHGKA